MNAYAKINWTLEVLGKRPDGYHELRSIVLPIALHDELEVAGGAQDGIAVEGCADIPLEKNLIYRAAQALARHGGIAVPKVLIKVVKKIPAGAGLGGGSADAAATLRLLNDFWQLGLGEAELAQIGAEIGSDVPALVYARPVLMEGRGERVRPLTDAEVAEVPRAEDIEVFTPKVFASTAAVYAEFKPSDCGKGRNDLQAAALRLYPEIATALEMMRCRGLKDVAMSGSGSSVYGVR